MAIQKMAFLKIVGSVEDMHEVLKRLILCENLHVVFNSGESYDNSYIIHKYESIMTHHTEAVHEDYRQVEEQCREMEQTLENLAAGLNVELKINREIVMDNGYGLKEAYDDLKSLTELIGPRIREVNQKREEIARLENFAEKLEFIKYRDLDLDAISHLNYFDYEIGSLSRESTIRLRKNYENISAIALNLGTHEKSGENLCIIVFPKSFREETASLLRSLNWTRLEIPECLRNEPGNSIRGTIEKAREKIELLNREIGELSGDLEKNRQEYGDVLNRIFTVVKLEKKILSLEKEIVVGQATFVLNAWIRISDRDRVASALAPVMPRLIIEERSADELEHHVTPPTKFRNNRLFKPFEELISLYGLPSYYELDPTPFIAIAFCLMFGIMFGDIGQGLVYFLAGVFLRKKMKVAGQVLMRLGASSTAFGFVYGSFFGLEQSELPWLPSLIGKPLDPKNIPAILLTGVIFGVAALTVSFAFGIINSLRVGDLGEGIFGRNGVAGYVFFISLVLAGASLAGFVALPVGVPVTALVVSFFVMLFREPIANLVQHKKPLIHGSVGTFLTESIFEGVETILATLSNAISFIRVGAFALNHAGLFLAFLVMSELTENFFAKLLILLLGNILILSLEGLVVFIQGLRLSYYEMFSKFFRGEGVAFDPVRIDG